MLAKTFDQSLNTTYFYNLVLALSKGSDKNDAEKPAIAEASN